MEITIHLRAVHFTLILVCIVTTVSLGGLSPTELDRAQEQLRHITQIKAEWDQWLNRWGLEQVQALETRQIGPRKGVPTGIFLCDPLKRNWSFQLKGSPMRFLLSVRGENDERVFADAIKKVNDDLMFSSGTRPWPDTLKDFKNFWDSADSIRVQTVESIDGEVHFISEDGSDSISTWTPRCVSNSQSGLDLQVRRTEKICSERVLKKLSGHIFCADIPNEKITVGVPVKVREDRLWQGLRSWLTREYRLQIAAEGFAKDFRELNKITAPYVELSLDRAASVLDAEVQRTGERVEVIGLSLPLRTLYLTAAGIIVLVQLYLLLHLRQFQLLRSDTKPIAWVALYNNLLARLVTIATGTVLPVATCIYVTMTHFSLWNVAFSIVSSILAVCSGLLFWHLPRNYDQMNSGKENTNNVEWP